IHQGREDGGIFWYPGADVLEFRFPLIARDGDVTPLVGDDTPLKRRIVEPAAQAKDTPQLPLLGRSEDQFVLVGLADAVLFHRSLFCLIGAKPQRLQHAHALLRGLKPSGMRRAKALFCQPYANGADARALWADEEAAAVEPRAVCYIQRAQNGLDDLALFRLGRRPLPASGFDIHDDDLIQRAGHTTSPDKLNDGGEHDA